MKKTKTTLPPKTGLITNKYFMIVGMGKNYNPTHCLEDENANGWNYTSIFWTLQGALDWFTFEGLKASEYTIVEVIINAKEIR